MSLTYGNPFMDIDYGYISPRDLINFGRGFMKEYMPGPSRKRATSQPQPFKQSRRRINRSRNKGKKPIYKRKRGKMSRTGNMSGRYIGKFKKAKRVRKTRKRTRFMNKGVVIKLEDGGIQQDAQCVYVGVHNSPNKQLHQAMWYCVTKCLYKKYGIEIESWTQTLGGLNFEHKIRLGYRRAGTSALQSIVTAGFDGADSYNTVATAVANLVETSGLTKDDYFDYAFLTSQDTIAGGSDVIVSRIDMAHFSLEWKNYGLITVQNRTNAGTSTGAANIDENENSVTNNPLVGKLYNVKNLNQLRPNFATKTIADEMLANTDRGYLSFSSNDAEYNKPPKGIQFENVKSSSRIMLQPGEIKKYTVRTKKYVKFNTFWTHFAEDLYTDDSPFHFGDMVVMGFEKLLDSRNDEQSIEVGFETNITINCGYKYKPKVVTEVINKIGTTGV